MEGIESSLMHRIRMEYLEMPGLALTRQQASRFWNIDAVLCDRILSELVHERFLARATSGSFLRRDTTA